MKLTAFLAVSFLLVGLAAGVSITPLNAVPKEKTNHQNFYSFQVTINNETLCDKNLTIVTDSFLIKEDQPATINFSIHNTGLYSLNVASKMYSDRQVILASVGDWATLQPNETSQSILYCLSLGTIPVNENSAQAIFSFVGTPTQGVI